MFTSQSTQSQADPTTEEQSEEIKKKTKKNEVSQTAQSKHMCFPHRLIIPPDAGPHGAVHCGKCPHTQTSGQCHRCGDLHRTQHQSNNGRAVFGNATSGFISARESFLPCFYSFLTPRVLNLAIFSCSVIERTRRESLQRKGEVASYRKWDLN